MVIIINRLNLMKMTFYPFVLQQAVRSGRVQYVTSGSGLKARIRHFQNGRHEEKLGHRHGDKVAASQRIDSVATALSKDKLTARNRLKVCEGAVQSKLPIFDRRVNSN